MRSTGTLYFFCGKMASGKSTLAQQIAKDKHALLLSEDQILAGLYPDEIVDVQGYSDRARKVRAVFQPVVEAMLSRGLSVVMDFPANTTAQRNWFRKILEATGVDHELHLIVCDDSLCKKQLAQRAHDDPKRRSTDTIEMFEAISQYYQPVTTEERFVIVEHHR